MKLRIGAGTIITVLLALAIGGYGLYQQRRTAAQPLVVERSIQGSTGSGVSPVPEFLLRHQADLLLTADQAKRLRAIASAYRKDVAPYQQRIQFASANYREQMERTERGTRHKLQELQNWGGDVRQLSSIMATTRQAYWQRARTILTVQQRAKVDHLVSKARLQDLQ